MKRTIILSLLILCSVAVADAETYKWTDDQGVVRSSDDPAQIPSRYRSKALMVEDLPITRKTGVTAPRNVAYTAKNYAKLIGMAGFSEAMLKNHFTLYQGYVTNTNKLLETLEQMLKDGKAANPEFAELKRRLGSEFNGMRLHEYYFETLGGNGKVDRGSRLARKKIEDFGSIEAWQKDFMATGAMRGIGWVVLYQDNVSGRLFNFWINEHDQGHPAGCMPILVMDVFEHAFMLDYGLKRADYVEAFFKNVDWKAVEARLK
jgi:Fe-Mn family superoxide dismutase